MTHQPVSMARIREFIQREVERQREERAKPHFFILHPGLQTVRFLPPRGGQGLPFKTILKHYNTPPNGKPLLCLDPENFPGASPCPICEVDREARQAGLDLRIGHVERYFWNGVIRGWADGQVHVLELAASVHRSLLAVLAHPDHAYFLDPHSGSDVLLTKRLVESWERTRTEYQVRVLLQERGPIFPDSPTRTADALSEMVALDRLFVPPAADSLGKWKAAAHYVRVRIAAKLGKEPPAPYWAPVPPPATLSGPGPGGGAP